MHYARHRILIYVSDVLTPFNVLSFSIYMVFAMYLDIRYIYVYNKIYESRKAKTTYNSKCMEYF
jgi:hypothetical protein